MSQNDPKTTSLMTSVTNNPHPRIPPFSSAFYETGRSIWALEQLSSAIGRGARALVRQLKTVFLGRNRSTNISYADSQEVNKRLSQVSYLHLWRKFS